jgi:hypothetical protein
MPFEGRPRRGDVSHFAREFEARRLARSAPEVVSAPSGTGVQLTDDGETRISAVSELPPSEREHEDACGVTTASFKPDPFRVVSVTIELLWPQPPGCDASATLLHELIHSLRRSLYTSPGASRARSGRRVCVGYRRQAAHRVQPDGSIGRFRVVLAEAS